MQVRDSRPACRGSPLHHRVYQMRASGRRGEAASYRLNVSAGAGGSAGRHPQAPAHHSADALVSGTPYHAVAPVRCRVNASMRWGQCKAGVIRRPGSATVHVDTLDGGERTILFRDGRPVSSDSTTPLRTTRRAQGGPSDDKAHSAWRYSLMNWGHDPLK